MNVFAHELKEHKWGLFWWSLGMIFMIYASMTKYSAFAKTVTKPTDLFKLFPKSLLAVFGMSNVDITTALGFFSIIMMYLIIMGAIHASLLGAGILTEEEIDRTAEFLYAKPISRARIITEKMLAAAINVAILNIVTMVSSVMIVASFNKGESATKGVVLFIIGLLFVQFIFMALGMAAASVFRRPKLAAPAVTGYLLAAYFISVWMDATDKYQWLKYFTPFKYFAATTIVKEMKLDPVFVILSLAISGIMIGVSYYFYRTRDLYI